MSSRACYLYDDGVLYNVPEEHVALRARWPLAVRAQDRPHVLERGVHGLIFDDIKPTHCAVVVFDIGQPRSAALDASLQTAVPPVHDDEAPPLFEENSRRCLWCLEMHVGAVRVDDAVQGAAVPMRSSCYTIGDSVLFPLPTRQTRTLWRRVRDATHLAVDTPNLVTNRLAIMASERCAPTYTRPVDLGLPALAVFPTHEAAGLRLSFLSLKNMSKAQNDSEFLRRAEVRAPAPKSPAPRAPPAAPAASVPEPASVPPTPPGPPPTPPSPPARSKRWTEGSPPARPSKRALASASTSALHPAPLRLDDLPPDLFSVIVSQMLVDAPETAMAVRGMSRYFCDAVDATMIGALERGSGLLAKMLACSRVADLLELDREVEALNFDALSLLARRAQKRAGGDETWRACDYGCVVRRVPGQALDDVAPTHPFDTRRRGGR